MPKGLTVRARCCSWWFDQLGSWPGSKVSRPCCPSRLPTLACFILCQINPYSSSGESRGIGAFCETAKYKGGIVRVRTLQFERKKDINRDVMKEMKLMRELRHDNVNSFIGACVDMPDPTDQSTITLITEYCAKGALNDILENRDIKLDAMFLSSLIHDLIKVIKDCDCPSRSCLTPPSCYRACFSSMVLNWASMGTSGAPTA